MRGFCARGQMCSHCSQLSFIRSVSSRTEDCSVATVGHVGLVLVSVQDPCCLHFIIKCETQNSDPQAFTEDQLFSENYFLD